jgi:hypothetical protein
LSQGLAPETRRDPAPFDDDRRRRLAGLFHPRDFEQSLAPALGDRHIGRPSAVIAEGHGAHSFIAASRSRATNRKISSFRSSVRLILANPSSNSFDRPPLRLNQGVDLLIDRAATDEFMDKDG